MDIRCLETFLKVCDLNSFTLAAEAQKLSQPGVSKQVQRLEATLGAPLFRRGETGLSLTDFGREVYRRGKVMVAEWQSLIESCKQSDENITGLLRISASTIPARHLLPRLLNQFLCAFPNVELSIDVCDSQAALERMQKGEVEIACVGAKPASADIRTFPLDSDRLTVIANTEWCAHSHWAEGPFILREAGSGTRRATEEALAELGIGHDMVKRVAEVNNSDLIIDMVEAGMGLAIVSNLDAEAAVQAGCRIQIVYTLSNQRQFYLACRRSDTHPRVQAFIDVATSVL